MQGCHRFARAARISGSRPVLRLRLRDASKPRGAPARESPDPASSPRLSGGTAMNRLRNLAQTQKRRNMGDTILSRYWRNTRRSGLTALVALALGFAAHYAAAHPVPGTVADEIPQPQANNEMSAEGNRLSNNRINTQNPE